MKQKLLENLALIRHKRLLVVLAALPKRSKIIIAGVLLVFVTGSSVLGYKIYQTQNKSPDLISDVKPSENPSPVPSVVVQTPLPTASLLPIKSPLTSSQPTTSAQDSPTPTPTPSPENTAIPTPGPTTSPTPTPTPQNACTPVTFSQYMDGNTVIVKVEGAWWLSVKESPSSDDVTFDTTNLIIFLHFNTANSGTVYIYEKSYESAPLCQTYNWSR